jgi:hypothetical protein
MIRILKAFLALVAVSSGLLVAGVSPTGAQPCWRAVILDWSHDQQIQGTYSIQCYRDALANAPEDIQMYSDFPAAVTRAMQQAIRQGTSASSRRLSGSGGTGKSMPKSRPKAAHGPIKRVLDAIGPTEARSVPIPMIVLGGIALLLVATGVAGMVVRRLQARRIPPGPPSS